MGALPADARTRTTGLRVRTPYLSLPKTISATPETFTFVPTSDSPLALLSPRQQQVLRATVRHYIDTVEPVSSGALVQRFHLNASPATVRNAMVWLERQGLLRQPHTSAGRIPSQQGYRHYVDDLLPHGGSQVQRLQRELNSLRLQVQWTALDDLLRVLAGRLADLTGLLALITRPTPPTPRLGAMRLVPSGERLVLMMVDWGGNVVTLNIRHPPALPREVLLLERWLERQLQAGGRIDWQALPPQGRSLGRPVQLAFENHLRQSPLAVDGMVAVGFGGLIAQPEFRQARHNLRDLLQLVEERPEELLKEQPQQCSTVLGAPRLQHVSIGREHKIPPLATCGLVKVPYGGHRGTRGWVAVLGPMRMAYETIIGSAHTVATLLEQLLT